MSTAPKLMILADDFTGTLDTAVQFAKRGIKTLVIVQGEDVSIAYPAMPKSLH